MENKKKKSKFALIWTIVIIISIISIVAYFLLRHPYFNLINIEMDGNKTYTIEDFKNESKLYGKNYFLANIKDAEKNLTKNDKIIEVDIKKEFPNKLKVEILEKTNIAYIVTKNKDIVFIDTLGNISNTKEDTENLPEIVGINTDLIVNNSIFNDATIKEIFDSVEEYNINFTKLNLTDKKNMFIEIDGIDAYFGDKKQIKKKFEIISEIISENDTKGIDIKEIKVSNVKKPVVIAD
ncbi:cell division protein FtsQ/DivIB [Mediannikoviicoccus vaginalis]|uniref:cell division protein FtsQ/DivIB n=1 Tax=Mediannikoviicoccus vaginalis TaxID=2899727 RepID=UPI001F37B82B|nr:FtsQ-type POTRA domain-containing protein [Mediannikoviicoccus vaginalis]